MVKKFNFFVILFLIAFQINANGVSEYYLSAEGLSGEELKTALFRRVSKHQFLLYDELWNYFKVTDALPNNRVLDRYSNTEYFFTQSSQMDREHSFPKSWWGGFSFYPVYSDLHHLYPSDRSANIAKSNHPLGKVSNSPSFNNGLSKVGPSVTAGYSGTVFEPADEYKGDFARAYMYVVTAYQNLQNLWNSPMLNNNTYPVFKQWAIDLLLQWHTEDPVSTLEIERNEQVYNFQNNRNPFIDYPELAQHIWGNKQTELFYTSSPITQPTIVSPWQDDVVVFRQIFEDDETETTIFIRGIALTGDLTVAITNDNDGYFSIPTNTITKQQAETSNAFALTIKYSPTEVKTSTANLTVSGGGASSVTISLEGTSLNRAVQKPEALPVTNIEENSASLSWTPVYKATNYLLDLYKHGNLVNTVVVSENFDGFFKTSFASNSQGAHSSDVSDSLDFFMQYKEWSGDKIYHANKTAKLGTSSAKGYIATPIIDLSHNNGLYTVKFDAKRWEGTSEKTTILILHNNQQVEEVTLTTQFQSFQYTYNNGTPNSIITITAKVASANRFFLDNISIEQLQPILIFVHENYDVGTNLFFDAIDLAYDTEYFFRVKANKEGDISANSNIVSFRTSTVGLKQINQIENVDINLFFNEVVLFNQEPNYLPVKIYTTDGRLLLSDILQPNATSSYFLNKGLYLIKVGNSWTKKILV